MDSPQKLAITAITDAQGESFIASSLERQGWKVIYRALAERELLLFVDSHSGQDMTLFSSAEFSTLCNTVSSHHSNVNVIHLRDIPSNDFDFSEVIRGAFESTHQDWAKIPSTPIVAFTSFGRTVGTSTIALNVAAELSESGSKVLLVDAHIRSPFLSSYLRTFGVNREVIRSPLGFSIFEADSSDSFRTIEQEIAHYEILLIDLGQVWRPAEAISGLRQEDYGFTWAAHYAQEMFSISSEQSLSIDEVRKCLLEFERLAIRPKISHIFNFSQELSPKERTHREIGLEQEIGHRPTFLPRDDRALSRARAINSTLPQSSPKSGLRAEIARFCKDKNWYLS